MTAVVEALARSSPPPVDPPSPPGQRDRWRLVRWRLGLCLAGQRRGALGKGSRERRPEDVERGEAVDLEIEYLVSFACLDLLADRSAVLYPLPDRLLGCELRDELGVDPLRHVAVPGARTPDPKPRVDDLLTAVDAEGEGLRAVTVVVGGPADEGLPPFGAATHG